MSEEAPLVITIKVEGGPSSPWIVLRSSNPNQAQQDLDAIAASGLADAIGRAHAAVNAGFNAGNVLGARTEAAPVGNGFQPAQPSPQAPANPGWEQGPPPAFAQPQPGYNQQPAQAYAQAAANGYQQQQAPQPQYQPPAAPTVPGAPLVLGQPAKLIQSKPGAARAWQAWADPRPKNVTDGMEATADVNDPGLANGTKKLWAFIK
jgi:hypothetical protein